jgi:serine/threonine protein kinase
MGSVASKIGGYFQEGEDGLHKTQEQPARRQHERETSEEHKSARAVHAGHTDHIRARQEHGTPTPVRDSQTENQSYARKRNASSKVLGVGGFGCVVTESACADTTYSGPMASKLFFSEKDARQDLAVEIHAARFLEVLDPESKSSIRLIGHCTRSVKEYADETLAACKLPHPVRTMLFQADYPLGGKSMITLNRRDKPIPYMPFFLSFAKLMDLVHRLHTEKKMFHSDISLANVLVDMDTFEVRLIDWGYSGPVPPLHLLEDWKYYVYPPDTPLFVAARTRYSIPSPFECRMWFNRYRESLRWALGKHDPLYSRLTNAKAELKFEKDLSQEDDFQILKRMPGNIAVQSYYPSIDTFSLGLIALFMAKTAVIQDRKTFYHLQMLGLGMAAPVHKFRVRLPAALQYLHWILYELPSVTDSYKVPEFAKAMGFRDHSPEPVRRLGGKPRRRRTHQRSRSQSKVSRSRSRAKRSRSASRRKPKRRM